MLYQRTYLDLKGKILFQVFNDHHQKGQLNTECFLWVGWCTDVGSGDIGALNLQHQRLNIIIGYSFNVPIANFLVPNL